MLSRIAGQAAHVREQHAALTLAPLEIAKASKHRSDEGMQVDFVGRNGKADAGGAAQEFPDLLNCFELCFVHIDHHALMIDPKSLFQPHMPLETRTTFQPHMPLEETDH